MYNVFGDVPVYFPKFAPGLIREHFGFTAERDLLITP